MTGDLVWCTSIYSYLWSPD